MTDEKKNIPRSRSNTTSFHDPAQIREQAERRAQSVQQPDFSSMTPEEIQQQFYEMQVKQIETGLEKEQLRNKLEEKKDQAELFSIVNENMLDMVALTDMEGNFTFAGKFHEILGYEPDYLIGKNVMDFVHPEDFPRLLEAFNEFVASGHPRRVEYRYRCEDGTYLWFETVGNFITDEKGTPQKIVFTSRDITEHKKVEDALRESEARFRLLYEKAPLGYQSLDEKGHFIQVNQAWLDALGYVREEVIGKSFADFLPPDWRDHFKENFPRFKAIGEILGVEFEMVKKNGAFILVSFNGKISEDKHGNFQQTHCIFYDITERKQAEEALRESEEKFRIVFEQSAIGIGLVNLTDACWVDVNETLCNMLGYTPEEMRTMPWPYITHPGDIDLDLIPFRRMAAGDLENYTVEKRFIHKQGHHVWAHLTLSLVRDVHGRPDYEIAIIENITQRKMAEEDLQALTDTLEQQVAERTELAEARFRQLQKLTVELIEAEERERRRIASLLHDDLQQLLASARMQVQITRQRYPSIELLKNVESVLKESIEESRDLSHELTPPVLQQGDMVDTIKWLAHRIKKQFGLQVRVEKTALRPRFKNVPLKLFIYRAVQELLFNIVKHSGVEEAWVIFSGNNDSFSITVTDQGRGFDPDILSSHEKVGLGLSSLAQRANSIGCKLDIKSTPGQGSRITLMVPVSLVEND